MSKSAKKKKKKIHPTEVLLTNSITSNPRFLEFRSKAYSLQTPTKKKKKTLRIKPANTEIQRRN